MKSLSPAQLIEFFTALSATHDVRAPIVLSDGTRTIGSLADGPLELHGGCVPVKPTAAFFPQRDTVFSVADGVMQAPSPPPRPLLVAGLTSCDLASLRFVDRFFADGLRDDIYFLLREHAIIIGVSGWCGTDGKFLPLAEGCDLELAWDRKQWLVLPHTEAGEEIAASLSDTVPSEALEPLRQVSAALSNEDETLIRRASALLREGKVPDSFWEEIAESCIACTGCNLVCPTCTCFGVHDWRTAKGGERSRIWDSCQLDGFMREASGHNPLGTQALRTRRRIHHKLAADPERWGEITCVACGRCDAACPTGIGMRAVARHLVARFG